MNPFIFNNCPFGGEHNFSIQKKGAPNMPFPINAKRDTRLFTAIGNVNMGKIAANFYV